MAPERSPAFQFYPKEFLADGNVGGMSLQERGAYITLLCFCWNDGSIPTDPARLATMCGTTAKAFAACWPAVRACFREHDGRFIHPRLERERAKQDDHRERRSDRGVRGAEGRWKKHDPSMPQASPKHDPSIAQAMLGDGSASASPSASPISISEQPSAVAAAVPRFVGKQKPIPGYRRLRIFPWMLDEMLGMLGQYADEFDLDKWLLMLDSSGSVLPPTLWPWMKEAVSAEAAKRGFGASATTNGTHTNIDAVREILRRDGVIE